MSSQDKNDDDPMMMRMEDDDADEQVGNPSTGRTEQEILDFWTKEIPVDVPPYLARIEMAVQQLMDDDSGENNHDGDSRMQVEEQLEESPAARHGNKCTSTTTTTVEESVERIAVGLLKACRLGTLTTTHSHLPSPPTPKQSKQDIADSDLPLEPMYQFRRIDYLRLLLRAMKPVAMDVAAHVCQAVRYRLYHHHPGSSSNGNDNKNDNNEEDNHSIILLQEEILRPAFILFSVWLPVAPHLTPLVTDLFRLDKFVCPLLGGGGGGGVLDDDDDNDPTVVTALPLSQQLELVTAAYHLGQHWFRRREMHVYQNWWWDWTPIYQWCGTKDDDDAMITEEQTRVAEDGSLIKDQPLEYIVRWFALRVAGYVRNLAGGCKSVYLKRHGVHDENVPWIMHPWDLEREEFEHEKLHLANRTRIWWREEFVIPGVEAVRAAVPLHPYLVHIGAGLVFAKHQIPLTSTADGGRGVSDPMTAMSISDQPRLVHTATTARNLILLGTAMCIDSNPPPILLCAPHGAGKSSLVRELARLTTREPLLEIHVDEETDTKTLVGSYTVTDVPGSFEWRPGALTRAVRSGQWVLLEDLDKVPIEIQASLQPLFKERLLPLGNGKVECCHPNFRLFATVTTHVNKGVGITNTKRLVHPAYWTKVFVDPLPLLELKEIALASDPTLPPTVVDSVLGIFQALDQSGRDDDGDNVMDASDTTVHKLWIGRHPSVRDVFKVLWRIAHGIHFERDAAYATESQRTLCMAESFDVFAAACPDCDVRTDFIRQIAAPLWGITAQLAQRYIETRSPTVLLHEATTEIGRVQIPVSETQALRTQSNSFACTNYALRLMESVAVCIRENEPLLLVGETGTGKTTILQQLALVSGRQLVVQNLSLQTDSTDLLGGYRPLEMQHVARRIYQEFVDLFTGTFSRKQNAEFLGFAATAFKKGQWKKLSQCFGRAAKLGLSKLKERKADSGDVTLEQWKHFSDDAEKFEQQRLACDSGLAFLFSEGALVDAIRTGKWVLLDEINLASSETLQRLCGLLDDSSSSLTLTERGDSVSIGRHPSFRLFAAMNPATDSGKKDIPASIRARFTEIFVDELRDAVELRMVAARYISTVLPASDRPPEHTEIIISIVDLYLQCRDLADKVLVDGSGQRPRYTLRTLSRALTAAQNIVLRQNLPLGRALYEGFQLAFQGPLDEKSLEALDKVIKNVFGGKVDKSQQDHPGRCPGGRGSAGRDYTLIKPFWIDTGTLDPVDWSERESENGRSRFILIPSTAHNLRRLARAVSSGPWPVLLEGPTSAGKTTLVEYLAARCGHHIIRINNHEHTDVQEYTGGFAADSNGSLKFHDGLLVQALRQGYWVILDELNLAPSEVLEALNRLLDDNRELYIPEINETVKAHPNFRLFATQNPSGTYGGRKPLSRAFRNRFVEIHISDIPSKEMVTILEQRCGCPPSHSRILVSIMDSLRQRRSRSGVFLGKDGFITPRDLLRWAGRGASSKLELAQEGYMLLAERLRTEEEKMCVKEEIERHLKVTMDLNTLYHGEESEARLILGRLCSDDSEFLSSIAPTKSLLRLVTLVIRCVKQREAVLLVGDTGCGKTASLQILSKIFDSTLHIVNCHQTTETSDLLGGLRPVRGRSSLVAKMLATIRELLRRWPVKIDQPELAAPEFVSQSEGSEHSESLKLPDDAMAKMVSFTRSLWGSISESTVNQHRAQECKRQRLDSIGTSSVTSPDVFATLADLVHEIEDTFQRYNALFEWVDGPLVRAMNRGEMILLDEMSLAEDAVLERLNSVLEPSRTLVLAEKGTADESESRIIVANPSFQLFATMNPGGDFGKRELSPALRSRFTEIWVPPVLDHSDIRLVLERALSSCYLEPSSMVVMESMMEYVAWFNGDLCADPSYPAAELSLSLRDILTWAQFVVITRRGNHSIGLWDAYIHGARLMHLDGLGLGTGLAVEDAESMKSRAESFLRSQLGEKCASSDDEFPSFALSASGRQFGSDPFWISTGGEYIGVVPFNFEAPTAAINILRVLRAMQLPKPVLLEGSPGVGKTTLVGALAAASGHKLVRINLSEQTDITDLIGSDLPVHESDLGSARAAFRWFDGVLLSAIKRGDWVLLDELNLASQSVLEGLNSCLDHRSTIFVPELGKAFDCPPTFRVFAAQNPLTQGGGRKGLPKSFLNRFTKVYLDTLSQDDLMHIVKSRFPLQTSVEGMVAFNTGVHDATVDGSTFGRFGSPWECNLRDIFRWCELLHSTKFESKNRLRFARDLYRHRFRTQEDREQVDQIYGSVFDDGVGHGDYPQLMVSDSKVQVGDVMIPRNRDRNLNKFDSAGLEPEVTPSLLGPLQAVARCIAMNWPCLLVGNYFAGKDSLIRTLAELTNSKVIEVSLSPSSDVSDLIGCFEQVDKMDHLREAADFLIHIAEECLLCPKPIWYLNKVSHLLCQLRGSMQNLSSTIQDALICLRSLASLLSDHKDEATAKTLRKLQQSFASGDNEESHFTWKDGPLVQAMAEGHWLHLKNANLCPSSVLDRLNPVMEPGGYLLLAECGADDSSTSSNHREVQCHSGFRVFLSMNPDHGEISRAMRNRCVELSISDNATSGQNIVLDCFASFSRAGLRSCSLGSSLLRLWHKGNDTDCNYSTSYSRREMSSSVLSSLLARGVCGSKALYMMQSLLSRRLGVVKLDHMCRGAFSQKLPFTAGGKDIHIPGGVSLKDGWALSSLFAQIRSEARLLAIFLVAEAPICTRNVLHLFQSKEHALTEKFMMFLPYCDNTSSLRDYVTTLVLCDAQARCQEVDYFIRRSSGSFKTTTAFLLTYLRTLMSSLKPELVELFHDRMPQILKERIYLEQLENDNNQTEMVERSILDISFLVTNGKLDKNFVECPVAALIFNFFGGLDQWLEAIFTNSQLSSGTELMLNIESLLVERDLLWMVSSSTKFSSSASCLLGFNDSEFIVQWMSLRKKLGDINSSLMLGNSSAVEESGRKLKIFLDAIEAAIFEGSDQPFSSSLIDRIPKPITPRTEVDWLAMSQIRRVAASCTVSFAGGSRNAVTLLDLIEQRHPILLVNDKLKREMLSALSTMQMASCDELTNSNQLSLKKVVGGAPNFLDCAVNDAREKFSSELHSIGLGVSDTAQPVIMDTEELCAVLSKTASIQRTFSQLSHFLLERFAMIQISPCAECICKKIERELIWKLCGALSNMSEGALSDCLEAERGPIKNFVALVISRTLWDVADLQPYQTLLWISEDTTVGESTLQKVLHKLLPFMILSSSKRSSTNAAGLFHGFSMRLELPVFPDVADFEDVDLLRRRKAANGTHDWLQTPEQMVFSLVADIFQFLPHSHLISSTSVENYVARQVQAQKLSEMLVFSSDAGSPMCQAYEIDVLTQEVFITFDSSFPREYRALWASCAREPYTLCQIPEEQLNQIRDSSMHPVFRGCFENLVLPLVYCIKGLRGTHSFAETGTYALAKIYIGLLRYHLLLPESPLDPGLKPCAEISLARRRLATLGSKLAALQLVNGSCTGDFFPQDDKANKIFTEGNRLIDYTGKQLAKVIRRPRTVAPFRELFRDTRELARTHLSVGAVLEFMNQIQSAKAGSYGEMESILRREQNWQVTTEAFCRRLLSKYEYYDDVLVPLVGSVGLIKEGIGLLAASLGASLDTETAFVVQECSTFPLSCDTSSINNLISILRNTKGNSMDSTDYKLCLALGVLSLLVLQKNLTGIKSSTLSSWYSVLSTVIKADIEAPSKKRSTSTEEEIWEEEFRSQFPDHRNEFQCLLQTDEFVVESKEPMQDTEGCGQEHAMDRFVLPDFYQDILCFLHGLLFSQGKSLDDKLRANSFRFCYEAARRASNLLGVNGGRGSSVSSGHFLALSLASGFRENCLAGSSKYLLFPSNVHDFHRDPNPAESIKAGTPLERLMARIAQLLNIFPGNAILVAVAKVADRVRKLDPLSTPLGKIMTGLEVILKHAQDWEEHASERVVLGEPLREIGKLVSSWRKLALQSWPELLRTREERFSSRARKLWMRIHAILGKNSLIKIEQEVQNQGALIQSPRWVWKGLTRNAEKFSSFLPPIDDAEHLSGVVKVLDTFCVTSPLAEFATRLGLLRSFAFQAIEESTHFGWGGGRLHFARSLKSLWLYYAQFSKYFADKLAELRRPFEARLGQEVKLAKWDEQTYYAMAESSERNHRKLMRILRQYDEEVLKISVASLLENELCRGIRPDFSSKGEPVSVMPSMTSLFTLSVLEKEPTAETSQRQILNGASREWTDPSLIGNVADDYITKIGQYAKKMASVLASASIGVSEQGANAAREFYIAIFDRIESLQCKSTTRPMKERALADLLKELKRHGYASTKWAVPKEIRQMGDLFLLPDPENAFDDSSFLSTSDKSALQNCEMYYQRCLAEVKQLRSEVSIIGSDHMTTRQLDLMLGFGEHGLLLLSQQRCILSSMLSQSQIIGSLAAGMSQERLFPAQAEYRDSLSNLWDEYTMFRESIHQVLLLLKLSQNLAVQAEKQSWVQGTMKKLESFLAGISQMEAPQITFVSRKHAKEAEILKETLFSASAIIEDCLEENRALQCLPPSCFDKSLIHIKRALNAYAIFGINPPKGNDPTGGRLEAFAEASSSAIKAVLLTVQAFAKGNNQNEPDATDIDNAEEKNAISIWQCHQSAVRTWAVSNVAALQPKLRLLVETLVSLYETDTISESKCRCCESLANDIGVLYLEAMKILHRELSEFALFHRETAKLQYILLRVFRALTAKGFCSEKGCSDDNNADDGEGPSSSMTFEDDKEGTGMGEGEGSRDVTDKIENEEQLLGLKDDRDDNGTSAENREHEQLNEEDAEKGMEMEAEFDGDMYDMPEKSPAENNENEGSDEEELDHEMGEEGSPNDEIIDEKLWDESDDDECKSNREEKFEQNSSVKGDGAAEEMTTKDDSEENKNDGNQPDSEPGKENADDPEPTSTQDMINDDFEDKYEENQGISVRNENESTEKEDDDGHMELDDNLSIDQQEGSDQGEAESKQEDDAPTDDTSGEKDDQPLESLAPDDRNSETIDESGEEGVDAATKLTEPQSIDDGEDVDPPEEDQIKDPLELPNRSESQHGLGVHDNKGNDAIQDNMSDDAGDDGEGGAEEEIDGAGAGGQDGNDGSLGNSFDPTKGMSTSDSSGVERNNNDQVPNPLTNPGDASKYWHRRLNMVEKSPDVDGADDLDEKTDNSVDETEQKGDFEYAEQTQGSTTQALGEVEEKDAVNLDDNKETKCDEEQTSKKPESVDNRPVSSQKSIGESRIETDTRDEAPVSDNAPETENGLPEEDEGLDEMSRTTKMDDEDDTNADNKNQIRFEIEQLRIQDDTMAENLVRGQIIGEEQTAGISTAEADEARLRWTMIQSETHNLSRRLCEKLRLVMEPLVASKLRGDYRTGKRINMKRVIGYIASGFRKDKIWLRRTKPAKRNYRVLLAVDDSESMLKSGAGEMALRAMATMVTGMSQLEVGDIGVASFGNEMKLVHPFHQPFTSDSGANVVRNFRFDQQRTRTALCIESALMALEDTPGENAAMQLVFMISDGRIERDSRASIRRLIREMVERNILLVLIIVEGSEKKSDSIINMKEVSFDKGKPNLKLFIEDYPFPYYIILSDMHTLPEVLGDALRQWFEILARLQTNTP